MQTSGTTIVSESGTTDTLSVVLDAPPATEISISISNSDVSEISVDKDALVFTPTNWNVAQVVTVTGVDDGVVDGDRSSVLTLSISAGATAPATAPAIERSVTVTTTDNETAGFSLSTTSATVAESGTSETFDVVLAGQPQSNVVIDVSSNDTGEATVSPGTLTFTPANWNVAQTVTITGQNDVVVDGDTTTTVTLMIDDASSDDAFDAVANQTVSVITSDDDVAPSLDYGDAADPSFPTLASSNGARHVVGALRLGTAVDIELDGQPSAAADGDGTDDDGVMFIATVVSADVVTTSSLAITVSGTGKLDAWIDFNQDGDWTDADEQIFQSVAVIDGLNVLSFEVPGGAANGDTFARFRLSTLGGLAPTGLATDGEVEDYALSIERANVTTDAAVDLAGSVATLVLSNGQFVVRDDQGDHLRVPVNSFGSLELSGTQADDTITLDLSGGDPIPVRGLQLDGNSGSNTLSVLGGDGDLDFTSSSLIGARNFAKIDLSDSSANTITVDATVVNNLSPSGAIVLIGGVGDEVVFGDAEHWRMGTTSISGGRFIRAVTNVLGGDESVQTDLPHAWRNVVRTSDVNNSGDVTASDALRIINELARRAFSDPDTALLVDPLTIAQWPNVYFDQNGDDRVSALDALRIINELARTSVPNGGGEGSQIDAVDEVMIQLSSSPSERDDRLVPATPRASDFNTPKKKHAILAEDLQQVLLRNTQVATSSAGTGTMNSEEERQLAVDELLLNVSIW